MSEIIEDLPGFILEHPADENGPRYYLEPDPATGKLVARAIGGLAGN